MHSSFELHHRYVFGIDTFEDTYASSPLEYLDDDTIIFLAGGTVILFDLKTKGQRVIKEEPSSKFKNESVHTTKDWILLLQSHTVNGTWRVAVVDKKKTDKRSHFDLYHHHNHGEEENSSSTLTVMKPYQVRICATTLKNELLIAALERRDGSNIVSLRAIDGTVLGQSTVAELDCLNDASVSFQSEDDTIDEESEDRDKEPKTVITVQTASSLLFYRVRFRGREGWNLSLANFPPSKMSLGISGRIVTHCTVRKRKETTVFFSSCRKLVCTESGIVTCSREEDIDIQCMVGLRDCASFVAGCSDCTFRFYQFSGEDKDAEEQKQLICSRVLRDPESSSKVTSKILSIALAPRGHVLSAILSQPNRLVEIDLRQGSDEIAFSPIVSVHRGSINSADACIQSPLLATAGSDGTIRLWDYYSGKSIMVTRPFSDVPLRLSIHPSGFHMLISFADEVLLAQILVDEIRVIRRMPLKHCRICTFSSGGNLFSLSHDNVIHIFDFIGGDKVRELKGHNSRVSSVLWIEGDTCIISCDEDGMIYRFDVSLGSRTHECSLYKSCDNIKYALVDDLWVYSDNKFDILSQESLSPTGRYRKKDRVNGIVTHILSSHEPASFCVVVLKETHIDGKMGAWVIRVYSTSQDHADFSVQEEITSISLSQNDQILIVCLHSGTIVVYDLTLIRGEGLLITEEPASSDLSLKEEWKDLTLVSGFVLQEKNSIFSGLATLEQELNANHEYRRSTCKVSNDEKASELEEKHRQLVNNGRSRLMAIQNKASEITSHHNAMSTRQQGIFQHASDQAQSFYRSSTLELVQEFNATKATWDSRIKELESVRRDTVTSNASSKNFFEEEMNLKLEECRNIVQHIEQKELIQIGLEHEEIIRQMEEDVDDEIESMKAQNKKKLASAREKTMKASSDNGIASKRISALQRSIEDCKDIIKMHLVREQDLQAFASKSERAIYLLNGEKGQKSDTLRIRKTAADRLKNKKRHLNNFTSILTDKLDEMKRHLPCDENVDAINKEIENLLKNLGNIRKENSEVETWLSNAAEMATIKIQKDTAKARKKLSKLANKRKNRLKLIQDCIDLIQRPEELRALIESEHTLCSRAKEQNRNTYDHAKEVKDLQTELGVVKKSLASIKAKQSDDLAHLKNENRILLSKIAERRKEVNATRKQISGLKK